MSDHLHTDRSASGMVPIDASSSTNAHRIQRLMVAAYRVEADLLGVEDFKPLRRSASSIQRAETTFFGVRDGDELVALIELDELGDAGVDICALVVAPTHFRRGLGRRLLAAVIARYRGRRMTVSTGAANRPARRLYELAGFGLTRRWRTPDGIAMVTLTRPVAVPASPPCDDGLGNDGTAQ